MGLLKFQGFRNVLDLNIVYIYLFEWKESTRPFCFYHFSEEKYTKHRHALLWIKLYIRKSFLFVQMLSIHQCLICLNVDHRKFPWNNRNIIIQIDRSLWILIHKPSPKTVPQIFRQSNKKKPVAPEKVENEERQPNQNLKVFYDYTNGTKWMVNKDKF